MKTYGGTLQWSNQADSPWVLLYVGVNKSGTAVM